jgi:hypothetical protein
MAKWNPKPIGVAKVGLYMATIHSTKYIGDAPTRYGPKHDVQAFVFRIKQADGELRDIHEQYPMTLDPRSNFVKLLNALDISVEYVRRNGIDPDNFVGKTLKVSVYHKTDKAKHANVTPLPATALVAGDPDPQRCDGNGRTCPYPAEQGERYCVQHACNPNAAIVHCPGSGGEPCWNHPTASGYCEVHNERT